MINFTPLTNFPSDDRNDRNLEEENLWNLILHYLASSWKVDCYTLFTFKHLTIFHFYCARNSLSLDCLLIKGSVKYTRRLINYPVSDEIFDRQ